MILSARARNRMTEDVSRRGAEPQRMRNYGVELAIKNPHGDAAIAHIELVHLAVPAGLDDPLRKVVPGVTVRLA